MIAYGRADTRVELQFATTLRTEPERLHLYRSCTLAYCDGGYPRGSTSGGIDKGIAEETGGAVSSAECWGGHGVGSEFSVSQFA